jgi:hypothetical protein
MEHGIVPRLMELLGEKTFVEASSAILILCALINTNGSVSADVFLEHGVVQAFIEYLETFPVARESSAVFKMLRAVRSLGAMVDMAGRRKAFITVFGNFDGESVMMRLPGYIDLDMNSGRGYTTVTARRMFEPDFTFARKMING